MIREVLLLFAMLGCAGPTPATTPVAPLPHDAAGPLAGWWEVADVDAAGRLAGTAFRIGDHGHFQVVWPTVPAFQVCDANVADNRVTISGCGQDTSATLTDDELGFAEGFHAQRATAARGPELEALIAKVQASCDRARGCYRAARPLLGLGDESTLFGPMSRADACDNIVINLASDLREAGKTEPATCAPAQNGQ
jgi:hypothetical protein